MSLFGELKRRNVFRVAIAYTAAAWLLTEVADVILPAFDAPGWVIRVLIAVVVLGLPFALVFSWVYELTPEGLKRESEVDRNESITRVTGRRLDQMTIGMLVLVLIVVLGTRWLLPPQLEDPVRDSKPEAAGSTSQERPVVAEIPDSSVAVLPFVNMSADAENEYFSDGISEELLNLLAQVPGLKVASRTASFQFKGHVGDVDEIGRKLKVATILEGSVRKADGQVRITAQLINAADGYHLWSETYDRELKDIFAVQDEIAGQIVNAMSDALGLDTAPGPIRQSAPTRNLDAYERYLRGRHLWHQRASEEMVQTSVKLLEESVALDPEFAEAQAALASAYVTLPSWMAAPDFHFLELGRQAAQRAIDLRPNMAEPYTALSMAAVETGRYLEAEHALNRAIELDPGYATAHQWLASFHARMGKLRAAREAAQTAAELNPTSPVVLSWWGGSNWFLGDYEEAREIYAKTIEMGGHWVRWVPAIFDAVDGNFESARSHYQQLPEERQAGGQWYESFLAAMQDPDQTDRFLMDCETASSTTAELVELCIPHAMVVDRPEKALEWLRRALADDTEEQILFWPPEAQAMRQLPGFKDVVRDQGLVEYWQQAGWPDLCRPVGEDDFECD